MTSKRLSSLRKLTIERLESRELLANDVPTARSVGYLAETMDQYHEGYGVYDDVSSPHSHFFEVARFTSEGAPDSLVHEDGSWTTDVHSGATVIRAEFAPSYAPNGEPLPGQFGGFVHQVGLLAGSETTPRANFGDVPNAGVNLTGATALRFWARGVPDKDGNLPTIDFFIGGVGRDRNPLPPFPDSAPALHLKTQLTIDWTEYTLPIPGDRDMSYVLGGFGWGAGVTENPSGAVFLLDDIAYELNATASAARLDQPRFLRSYTTLPHQSDPFDPNKNDDIDFVLRNTAFTYDNALALLAFLADANPQTRPDSLRRAELIGAAFVYAATHDREFDDGRIRTAYAAGDLTVPPGWTPNGRVGTVAVPGFFFEATHTFYEIEQQSVDVGNNAWTMIALSALYRQTGKQEYLDTAKRIGQFVAQFKSTAGVLQGFRGGLDLALVFEAEQFRLAASQSHQWSSIQRDGQPDDPILDPSGPLAEYLQALNLAGQDTDVVNSAPGVPFAEQDIYIEEAGLYQLDVRGAGVADTSNSLWVRFLRGQLRDAQSNQVVKGSLDIAFSDQSKLEWRAAGLWRLSAGFHTLRVAMHESGTVFDAIQLRRMDGKKAFNRLYASTEHNIDLYAAFTSLAELTGDAAWRPLANHAKAFVDAMFVPHPGSADRARRFFRAGTVVRLQKGTPVVAQINDDPNQLPLDVQVWSGLSIPGIFDRHPRLLSDVTETSPPLNQPTFAAETEEFVGVDFNADRDGVWFEGTGQTALALALTGLARKANELLDQLQRAQETLGIRGGVPAAVPDGLTTGFNFRYFTRSHIAATAWNIFARQGFNPFYQVHPWTNPKNALDVNGDSRVTSIDVLQLVSDLNRNGARRLSLPKVVATPNFLDPSGDGFVSAIDALLVARFLNPSPTAEAEASAERNRMVAFATITDFGLDTRRPYLTHKRTLEFEATDDAVSPATKKAELRHPARAR